MISNCFGLIGGLKISEYLGVSGVHATWVAAAYPYVFFPQLTAWKKFWLITSYISLTQGTFVLMSGRLGAIFGHKNMLLIGGAWFSVLTIINGFIPDFLGFCAIRALSGIGGALILPNGVAMVGITNPPGRIRNLSMGFFGASAPIGGYIGGIIVGLFIEYSDIKWCFVVVGLASTVVFILLWVLIPKEIPVDRNGKIDYLGAALGTSALIIFNFVWNQAPAVGWSRPYEYALLLCAITLFALFIYWESKTKHPIMPLGVFRAPSFAPLLIVVLLNFMTIGTVLWYMLLWQQNLRRWTALHTAIGWTPFLIVSTLGSALAAWLIPRLAAQWIVAIGAVTGAASNLLLATMPREQSYWAQVFPATIFMALCPDLTFTAAQIIASNAVRREQQGVAGSLIGTLNLYGVSLGIGFAATVESQVVEDRSSNILGYRSALYFGFGLAMIALLVDLFWVRLVKDEREGWELGDEGYNDDAGLTAIATGVKGVELSNLSQAPAQRS